MAVADRQKGLDAALAQIEKAHGKGSIMRLGEETRVPIEVIPTGSIALDVALGIGGLPRGRVVEVYGPESSGKTTVALHAIAMRVQDLRTMEQVNMQFFVSIDLTTNNNHLLAQAVDRTLTVTTNVITVGLAIAAALANQKRTMEATKATQEDAGNILASNAAAIRQQTSEIAQMYNNPVLALEKVQKSYDDLMAAMDEVEKVKRQGIDTAKQGMARLSDMSGKLAQKAGLTAGETLEAPKTPSVSSIEA